MEQEYRTRRGGRPTGTPSRYAPARQVLPGRRYKPVERLQPSSHKRYPASLRTGPQGRLIVDSTASSCICPAHGTEFVRWVQSSLNQTLSTKLRINGVMNRDTREALRSFQKHEGLPVDGIAGPETENALIKAKTRSTHRTDAHSRNNLSSVRDLEFGDPKSLNSKEITLLVWAILGETPSNQKWIIKQVSKTSFDVLRAAYSGIKGKSGPIGPDYFLAVYQKFNVRVKQRPYFARGMAMGMAYAILDFATSTHRSFVDVNEPAGIPTQINRGFDKGYRKMWERLWRVRRNKITPLDTLMHWLGSTGNKALAINVIYRAVFQVLENKMKVSGKFPTETVMLSQCSFHYPFIKVCCGQRPGCR